MKIKELMQSLAVISKDPSLSLKHKELNLIKEQILMCDEFKDVKELEIIQEPYLLSTNNNIKKQTQTFIISNDAKFTGKLTLYSLGLGPEVFNPNEHFKAVKNGAYIWQFYNPNDWELKQKFCIEISKEKLQDGASGTIKGVTYKQEMIKLFEDMLNSSEEYMIKGDRSVILRGIFED